MTGHGRGSAPDIGNAPNPPSVIDPIGVALEILRQMRKHCGLDDPDVGAAYRSGAAELASTAATMEGTYSPSSWQGSAARAHNSASSRQQQSVQNMSEVDEAVADLLEVEAGCVRVVRDVIDNSIELLKKCAIIADALSVVKRYGEIASMLFQVTAVRAVMPPARECYKGLAQLSLKHAIELRWALASYLQTSRAGSDGTSSGDTLRVTPNDLIPIADAHTAAAQRVAEAATMTDQTAGSVEKTHGVICAPTANMLYRVHGARADAAAELQSRSVHLAWAVKSAAAQYTAADRQAAGQTDRVQFPA